MTFMRRMSVKLGWIAGPELNVLSFRPGQYPVLITVIPAGGQAFSWQLEASSGGYMRNNLRSKVAALRDPAGYRLSTSRVRVLCLHAVPVMRGLPFISPALVLLVLSASWLPGTLSKRRASGQAPDL